MFEFEFEMRGVACEKSVRKSSSIIDFRGVKKQYTCELCKFLTYVKLNHSYTNYCLRRTQIHLHVKPSIILHYQGTDMLASE
jgi:hypothetical protein